jgi:hypothetical protein
VKNNIVFSFELICIVLANTSVFPIGSRCASHPCQNGGACYDYRSVDGYLCSCPAPYKGLHCHVHDKSCPESQCGDRLGKILPVCKPFTNDMALDYICLCYDWNRRPFGFSFAANNCYTDELFDPSCERETGVGAIPFTNKGFYICPWISERVFIKSCPLHHVWNGTQKECVLENY